MKFGTQTDGDDTVNQPNESNPGGNTIGGTDPNATQARVDAGQNNEPESGATYDGGNPEPSVSDLGIDVEKAQNQNPVGKVLAEVAAAGAMANNPANDGETVYSSHPIQNLMIGAFRFENTILKLKGDLVAEFEALLDKLPPQDRLSIRKIDTDVASQIVQDRMDANASATRAFDSSVGRSAMAQMMKHNPTIGTKPLEDMGSPTVGFAQNTGNADVIVDVKPCDSAGGEADSRAE